MRTEMSWTIPCPRCMRSLTDVLNQSAAGHWNVNSSLYHTSLSHPETGHNSSDLGSALWVAYQDYIHGVSVHPEGRHIHMAVIVQCFNVITQGRWPWGQAMQAVQLVQPCTLLVRELQRLGFLRMQDWCLKGSHGQQGGSKWELSLCRLWGAAWSSVQGHTLHNSFCNVATHAW